MNTEWNLTSPDTLVDDLDYDFSVSEIVIDSFQAFRDQIYLPFLEKGQRTYYRGERINSLTRPLLPTIFRNRKALISPGAQYADITADSLLEFYKSQGAYYSLFCSAFGYAGKYHMYDLCAFSQHYISCSPLIDFTKSLYVALSFGLKGKSEFVDDGLLYTVEISDPDSYTNDIITAECWLNDYSVRVYDLPKGSHELSSIPRTSPDAHLIDIASNDRMKFQQGVFLLLDQFTLINQLYLTRNVRSSFRITKYILNKDVCPELTALVEKMAPWYSFSNLLDIGNGIRTAIDYKRVEL